MTTTTELHAAIAKMQVLMTQAADVIEQNTNSLAEMHTRNGIIEDTEVQAAVESDTDLVADLRAAALPWDQRQKSTERPPSRAHQFPANQVEAVRAELQEAVEAHGLTAKPEPTDSMGMPISCSKPLCSPGDHHPLCKLAEQPAPVHPDSSRIDWLTNNPVDALDIFGHVKGADAVRWIRQEIDNAIASKEEGK